MSWMESLWGIFRHALDYSKEISTSPLNCSIIKKIINIFLYQNFVKESLSDFDQDLGYFPINWNREIKENQISPPAKIEKNLLWNGRIPYIALEMPLHWCINFRYFFVPSFLFISKFSDHLWLFDYIGSFWGDLELRGNSIHFS